MMTLMLSRRALRKLVCCCCKHPKRFATRVRVQLIGWGIPSISFIGDFMATVVKTGGPLLFDVSGFVDDNGNPVTDTDPATYTSSDPSVATVTNNALDPQDGDITLTGKVTAPGENVEIVASFPAQTGGQPFQVKGTLVVIEPAAAGATAVITGPGVIAGA